MDDQIAGACEAFRAAYGADPTHAAVAPGRVNLIGEHIDYCDGYVLPLAIERQAVVVGRRRDDGVARLRSTAVAGEATFGIDAAPIGPGDPPWSRYLRGVVAFSYTPAGFDLMLDSNVPPGGGLSSSAAIAVATATFLEAIGGMAFDPVNKALLCVMAEHRFGGTRCGVMDPLVSVMGRAGHALLIDCTDHSVRAVPMDPERVAVLIINTNRPHALGEAYNERRDGTAAALRATGRPGWRAVTRADLQRVRGTLDEVTYRRARHVVGEIARTTQCADALVAEDWPQVGELMFASHESLRDDFAVSTPELDALVESAAALGPDAGVIGSRMTGGGFGGCTVTLVHTAHLPAVQAALTERYRRDVGVEPTAFTTRPAAGARTVAL